MWLMAARTSGSSRSRLIKFQLCLDQTAFLAPLVARWTLCRRHEFRFPQPYAFRFCQPNLGGDREDKTGFPQLVEKRRLCLFPAPTGPAVGNESAYTRPKGRAGGRPEKLPADRLLQYLALHRSRRFTDSAARHWNPGSLRSRLESAVTHTPRSLTNTAAPQNWRKQPQAIALTARQPRWAGFCSDYGQTAPYCLFLRLDSP
jgi:hypothetical protein